MAVLPPSAANDAPVINAAFSEAMNRVVSCDGALLDCVDAIRVEGEMVLDLGDRGVRCLIGPDGIHRPLPAEWDAVVGTVTQIGAVVE